MKTVLFALCLLTVCPSANGIQQNPIVTENANVLYIISPEARNLKFIDRASGIDYLRGDSQSTCFMVLCSDADYPATSVTLENSRLTMKLSKVDAKAVLLVRSFFAPAGAHQGR
jgi:hypothetical protein